MKYTTQDLFKITPGIPKKIFVVRQHRYGKTMVTHQNNQTDILLIDNLEIFNRSKIDDPNKFLMTAFDEEQEAINYIEAKIEKRIRYDIEKLKVLNTRSRELAMEEKKELMLM